MSGSGFRGVSAAQDGRFSDKDKKLLKSTKFPDSFNTRVDMAKVQLEVIRPWIHQELQKYLGVEDDILKGYVESQLESKPLDPKQMQLSLTGFLEKNTSAFMRDLWDLLLSAQANKTGIPKVFLDRKNEELRQKKEQEAQLEAAMRAKREQLEEASRRLDEERLRQAALAAHATQRLEKRLLESHTALPAPPSHPRDASATAAAGVKDPTTDREREEPHQERPRNQRDERDRERDQDRDRDRDRDRGRDRDRAHRDRDRRDRDRDRDRSRRDGHHHRDRRSDTTDRHDYDRRDRDVHHRRDDYDRRDEHHRRDDYPRRDDDHHRSDRRDRRDESRGENEGRERERHEEPPKDEFGRSRPSRREDAETGGLASGGSDGGARHSDALPRYGASADKLRDDAPSAVKTEAAGSEERLT